MRRVPQETQGRVQDNETFSSLFLHFLLYVVPRKVLIDLKFGCQTKRLFKGSKHNECYEGWREIQKDEDVKNLLGENA